MFRVVDRSAFAAAGALRLCLGFCVGLCLRSWRPLLAALPAAALLACSSGPAVKPGSTSAPAANGAPSVPPPAGVPAPEPPRPTLAAEQERLADLFRGTPVVFVLQPDGSLRVEVPLRYSFDPGASAVKPPLAKVLDLLAAGQRKGPSRWLVIAPSDKRSKALALATDRAGSVRDYLVGHGIGVTRFAPVTAVPEPELVRLVLSESGPPKIQP